MSEFVGTGPSSYEKRIYRAAVSQGLGITALRDMRQTKYAARSGLMTDAFRTICRAVQRVRTGQKLQH